MPAVDLTGYSVAADASQVVEDGITLVTIDGQVLLLTRTANQVYAFTRWCPHASGDLSQGAVYNGRVVCSEHNWVFDLTANGAQRYPNDEFHTLGCYPTKIVRGKVYVRLPQR